MPDPSSHPTRPDAFGRVTDFALRLFGFGRQKYSVDPARAEFPALNCGACGYDLWGELCDAKYNLWNSPWYEERKDWARSAVNERSANSAIHKIAGPIECRCPECGTTNEDHPTLWYVLTEIWRKEMRLSVLGLNLPDHSLQALLQQSIDPELSAAFGEIHRYAAISPQTIADRKEILLALIPELADRTEFTGVKKRY